MPENLQFFINKISKGSVKYSNPINLTKKSINKLIDKKLRKTIYNINKSNWAWTIWSCQGHKYKNKECSLPYLIFIVRNEYISHLSELLLETVDTHNDKCFPVISSSYLQISKGYSDRNFTILSCYWSLNHIEEDDMMKRLHKKLAILSEKVRYLNGS
jgi:hypothetical protein